MLKSLADWFDDRTNVRSLVRSASEAPIPGGARWRYAIGAALASTFLIQLATGLLMMLSYSPSSSTAWGSVFYINEQMTLGWVIRGIHHFGSGAMMTLLVLHLMQVVLAGAYRRPREVNWWFGMALLFLVLGFSLTGYLLPWDQKGYWATNVATSIMSGAPVLGPYIQKLVIGGTDYGNQTLTRFYGLHVGLLPTLFFLCVSAHIALVCRHGVTPPADADRKPAGKYWPEQIFMFAVAGTAVLGILLVIVLKEHGANLDAPADPSSADYPARPEWYFLSLFQMLKVFPGRLEMIATIVIPTTVMTVLILIPLFDRIMPTKLAHFLACSFVFGLVGGAIFLSVQAIRQDAADLAFQADRKEADKTRQRAILLAGNPAHGVPPEGSAYVLLRDPLTHGGAVLEKKCLNCHYFDKKGLVSLDAKGKDSMSPQVASDLKDFGAYPWVRGLLDNPSADTYYGKVPKCDGMAEWKKSSKLSGKELDDVARFVADFAKIPSDMTPDDWLASPGVADHPGNAPFVKECGKCHVVPGLSEGGLRDAPQLFGWGSRQWIERMIHKPGSPDLYGYLEANDQMPAFSSDQLSENDMTMLIRYLKNDYIGAPSEPPSTATTIAARPTTPTP